jgi:hypothetical protein
MHNKKQEYVTKEIEKKVKLSEAELGSIINIESTSEEDREALRNFVYLLSVILYKSYENEKS